MNNENNSQRKLPRSLRNNNPLNIRRTSTLWKGQLSGKAATDMLFCQFDSAKWGWRAAFWLLTRTYYHKWGLHTVRDIIMRWAPPQDRNDTEAYISRVCTMTGLTATETLPIPTLRCTEWMKLAVAMAVVESGTQALDYFAMLDGWQLCRDDAAKGGF